MESIPQTSEGRHASQQHGKEILGYRVGTVLNQYPTEAIYQSHRPTDGRTPPEPGSDNLPRATNTADDGRPNTLYDSCLRSQGEMSFCKQLDDTRISAFEGAKASILTAQLEDIGRNGEADFPRRSARDKSKYATNRKQTGISGESDRNTHLFSDQGPSGGGKPPRFRRILSEARGTGASCAHGNAAGMGRGSKDVGEYGMGSPEHCCS